MKRTMFLAGLLTVAVLFAPGCQVTNNFYDTVTGFVLNKSAPVAPEVEAQPAGESYKNRKYGLLPDKPDKNVKLWQLPVNAKTVIPAKVDFSVLFPDVYDQGNLGSCTANGLAAAVDYIRKQQGLSYIYPSRLFIYYNERDIEGSVNEDSGAAIQDGVKSLMRQGVCKEITWGYDISKFKTKPHSAAYAEAMDYQALEYAKIPNANLLLIKQTLANHYPIVFGFMVYQSFETAAVAKSGIVPMPKTFEQCLGGHCVVMVGYDDNFPCLDGSKGAAFVRNSWGNGWGIKGYFWMPYKFILKYASDFWVIKKVE